MGRIDEWVGKRGEGGGMKHRKRETSQHGTPRTFRPLRLSRRLRIIAMVIANRIAEMPSLLPSYFKIAEITCAMAIANVSVIAHLALRFRSRKEATCDRGA